MSQIEIKIDKENNDTEVSLSALSINTTNALIEILTALRNIALYENKADIKIGLIEGSACAILEGDSDTMEDVHNSIMKVVHNSADRDNIYVANLQIIKDQINDRELNVDIVYKPYNAPRVSLRQEFNNQFRKRRERKKIENNFKIEFFEAELNDNGGDNPNFHVIANGQRYKISCTREEAQRVNPFLYNSFKFSAWAKIGSDEKIHYQYCDIYEGTQRDFYTEFKTFFSELSVLNGTEPIKKIHYKLKEFYSNSLFNEARKFIRIFINDEAEINHLMAILIISKTFKNNENLSDLLQKVENLIERKTKKPVL